MSAPACPACGEPLRYSATKLGGFSFSCGACGTQGFAKSPRAAAAWAARNAPAAPPAQAPAAPPAGKPAPKPRRLEDREVFGE